MNRRKWMFILPNLFTVSSIFCGFYALTLCAGEATPAQLYQAALAIFFAMFFDGFDGRVARLTKTQSQFGVELDSLADVISFGAAPAILVYKWALAPLGFIGLVVAFAFAACGALRLARFNVLAQRSSHGGGGRFFVGLPIPLAAGVIVSMVIAHYGALGGVPGRGAQVPIAAAVGILSLLMVSTLRYRTFKDVRLSAKSATFFLVVCVGGVLVATQLHPAFILVAYFSAYLTVGLVESGFLLRSHLASRRLETAPSTGLNSEASPEDDEDDFL
ncbi:MAG TPA: CDP-diacylglycerol--serine O-phosphatidyltransferase [Myxococcaceae bacterium]|nr:CDP-diacylglycerol--serine O-phosphatidyltransferase [Myxococcaceae bacterium]